MCWVFCSLPCLPQVPASPWRVMAVLGVHFGYEMLHMPIGGLVASDSGERRTAVFNLQIQGDK